MFNFFKDNFRQKHSRFQVGYMMLQSNTKIMKFRVLYRKYKKFWINKYFEMKIL